MTSTKAGKQAVKPDGMYDAATMGYSHGILVGDHLEIAGQVSMAEGVRGAGRRDLRASATGRRGCRTMADIVKMTMYTTQQDCWEKSAAVRDKYVPPPFPTATMVVVVGLAHPSILLEVEATAIIGSGSR